MSHIRVKTTYEYQDAMGYTEKGVVYADHNLSCDVSTYYDEHGTELFSVDTGVQNDMLDAIIRLRVPYNGNNLVEGVEYLTDEEIKLIKS